jgi:hypothetical protein
VAYEQNHPHGAVFTVAVPRASAGPRARPSDVVATA